MIQVEMKKGDHKTLELRCEILAAMSGLLYLDSWKFGARNYRSYRRILTSTNHGHLASDEFAFENILNVFQAGRTPLDDYSDLL